MRNTNRTINQNDKAINRELVAFQLFRISLFGSIFIIGADAARCRTLDRQHGQMEHLSD